MLELKGNCFALFGTPTIPEWPANSSNLGGPYGTDGTDGNKPGYGYAWQQDNVYQTTSPFYYERSQTALGGGC